MSVCGLDQPQATHNQGGGGGLQWGHFKASIFALQSMDFVLRLALLARCSVPFFSV